MSMRLNKAEIYNYIQKCKSKHKKQTYASHCVFLELVLKNSTLLYASYATIAHNFLENGNQFEVTQPHGQLALDRGVTASGNKNTEVLQF